VSEFEKRQTDKDVENASSKHPPGWQPGVEMGAFEGTMTFKAPENVNPDDMFVDPAIWALVAKEWGLNPDITEIIPDSVQIRAWDMPVGKGQVIRAKYYKCRLRTKRGAITKAEREELAKMANRRKGRRELALDAPVNTGVAFVVNLSDFQIGKGEGGGTDAAITRIRRGIEEARERLKMLRKAGKNITTVVIAGLGDLAEMCFGNYPNQLFTVDRTRRQQLQIVRKLIMEAIDAFVDLAKYMIVSAVPGNHGENRQDGKMVTTVDDNDDLAVFDCVREQCEQNPKRFGHIQWEICGEYVQKLNICGVNVAWTHMHQGGGSGEKKIAEWWKGQVMGNRPVADAQILFTAHYHHLMISEVVGRTIVQVPAMDGGSAWWTERTGQNSPSGMVTLLVGAACGPRGWSDLDIHGQEAAA
jgi:hypothetical protein